MAASQVPFSRAWYDYSRPHDFTITLSLKQGTQLQAIIGAFISTIVAGSIWTITSFVLHQIRARERGRTQPVGSRVIQAHLRNNQSPVFVVWKCVRTCVTAFLTRDAQAVQLLLPSIFICLIALSVVAGSITATVYSAKVTTGIPNFVLLESNNCGTWDIASKSVGGVGSSGHWRAITQNRTTLAAQYASTCYHSGTSNPMCETMPVREIKRTENHNASCPFAPTACIFNGTASFEMTTEMIDSNDHLGFNAPLKHRVGLQRRTTCTPTRLRPYTDTIPGELANETNYRIFYGNQTFGDTVINTLNVSDFAIYYSSDYQLSTVNSYAPSKMNGSQSAFQPVPDLARNDGDVSFFFLQPGTMAFVNASDDPFFPAHKNPLDTVDATTLYSFDTIASAMGCVDQFRLCNPAMSQSSCTAFSGLPQMLDRIDKLELSSRQISTVGVIFWALLRGGMSASISGRGAQALQAHKGVYDSLQSPLPNYQWKIETGSWFDVGLAQLQQAVVEFGKGPSEDDLPYLAMRKPVDPATCKIKVRTGGAYKSFSGVGICFIFAVGGFLWMLSWVFDTLVGFVQRQTGVGAELEAKWNRDSIRLLVLGAEPAPWRQPTQPGQQRIAGDALSPDEVTPMTGVNQPPKAFW